MHIIAQTSWPRPRASAFSPRPQPTATRAPTPPRAACAPAARAPRGVLLTEHLSYAFEDAASVDFLAGMAEASTGAATTLTLIPAGPDAPSDDAAALLTRAAVDGFVIYSVSSESVEAARTRGLPLVVCDQPKDSGLPFVGIDDREAIKPAARALLAAGHRRIGILCIRLHYERIDGFVSPEQVERADMHVQRDRVLGALDVFAQAGIGEIPIVTRHINDASTARAAAEELLAARPELTAVLCTTDSMALGVLGVLRDAGLAAPKDLSVTGFDGITTALLAGLTTVVQPNKAKGAAAGHMLAEHIDAALSETAPAHDHKLLPTRFNEGTTVGSPREQHLLDWRL